MQADIRTDVVDKSNFKKPGIHQHAPRLKINLPKFLNLKKDKTTIPYQGLKLKTLITYIH